ncbi:hypothetical protein EJB05_12033, partial [Eragrostis curvula]
MAQCTPDLSPADCRACLDQIVSVMPKHFGGRQGGRILGLRCNYRFELYPPFSGSPLLRLSAPALIDTPSVDGDLSRMESMQSINLPVLDLSILKAATENFAEKNKLGEGGFGAVYKGTLPDGQQIAVKRLSQGSAQGIGELKNELVLVAKLHHKNLVRLVGVCLEVQEKLVVYEYMPNRSLDTILFDPEKSKNLDWTKRFKIISGVARGLQYVHEDSQLKIIHRDLKTSNVLLDFELNPKISDFGLARLFEEDQTNDVTNRVIWEHWIRGNILDIVDPLLSSFSEDQVLTCAHVGLLCVQESPLDRPTMSEVNVTLSTDSSTLQTPSKPAFCIGSINNESEPCQGAYRATGRKPAVMSPNEVSLTELEPR